NFINSSFVNMENLLLAYIFYFYFRKGYNFLIHNTYLIRQHTKTTFAYLFIGGIKSPTYYFIFIFKLTHKNTNINKARCINVYRYYCENTKTYKITNLM